MSSHVLDVVEIRTPCPADWEQMAGDDIRRFCQHCQKHVHNLSAMPADEAQRLVCESAGRLCVRFARDESGKVLTLDYRGTTSRRWTWKVWTLIALVGATITASVQAVIFGRKAVVPPGATVLMGTPPPAFQAMMGDVAIPPQTTANPQPNPPASGAQSAKQETGSLPSAQ
jgi:hypothetical protein